MIKFECHIEFFLRGVNGWLCVGSIYEKADNWNLINIKKQKTKKKQFVRVGIPRTMDISRV